MNKKVSYADQYSCRTETKKKKTIQNNPVTAHPIQNKPQVAKSTVADNEKNALIVNGIITNNLKMLSRIFVLDSISFIYVSVLHEYWSA